MVGDYEVVQDFAPQDSLGHDPRNVFNSHVSVPDSLRVDHHGGAMFALLKAAGMVGPSQQTESSRLELFLEGLAQLLTPLRIAAAPRVAGRPDVPANEDMMRKRWHFQPLAGSKAAVRGAKSTRAPPPE
jgi:hypothetical protein